MKIQAVKTEADSLAEGSVSTLEKCLEIAREVPQMSCLVIMVGRDNQITHQYTTPGRIQLLGMIEYAKAKICED